MKRFAAALFCAVVLLSLFGCAKESRYNESPDLSKKVVGSSNMMATRIPLKSVAEMADLSDIIVTGTVISDSQVIQFNSSGNDEYAAAAAEKGINVYLPATVATVKITKVINGNFSDETVQVFQLGEPHTADMQTKLENGDFYIDEGDRLTSMGKELMCARYDGRPVSLLLEDLAAANCVAKSVVTEWKEK